MPFTNFHVISGLPRSGSTLLSAILAQNPSIHASVTSPLSVLMAAVLPKMSGGTEFATFFDDRRRRLILQGLASSYYQDTKAKVVIDTNRVWTSKISLLTDLYPDAKVICCVRDVGWIVDSLERMLQKNPLQTSRVFGFRSGGNVYTRAEQLLDSKEGLIGSPWACLRQAWFSQEASRLLLVRYETLTKSPEITINEIYKKLGIPTYKHDFNNIVFDQPEYDADLGMPGMHFVKPRVEPQSRSACIPPDLFKKNEQLSFWNNRELNINKVTVI